MEYLWNAYGIYMEYDWNMHGICMEYAGICMERVRGICMEYARNMHGTCMEYSATCTAYAWNVHGIRKPSRYSKRLLAVEGPQQGPKRPNVSLTKTTIQHQE